MNKRKIIEIFLTALISAGIAFLQSFLGDLLDINTIQNDPVMAGGIGTVLSTVKNYTKIVKHT